MTPSDPHGSDTTENISDVFAVRDRGKKLIRLPAKTRAFPFRESAPDAIAFAVRERVLEALQANGTVHANALRRVTGASALREEQVRISV